MIEKNQEIIQMVFVVLFMFLVFMSVIGLIWLILKGREKYNLWFEKRVAFVVNKYSKCASEDEELVEVKFPVYAGAIIVLHELDLRVLIPKSKAREFLNELARYNLTFGLITVLFPYVLFLTAINYFMVRSKV